MRGGTSRQPAKHNAVTNKRAARLHTHVAKGYAMEWWRKRPERQPHLAPEQGEDDARARRKTGGHNRQEARWRGRKADGLAQARWRYHGERRGDATEHARSATVIFLRNYVTGEPYGEASGRG
jgi:hypothetical protein